MREVTIVKPSASGTKRPSVTKVMVKGNETRHCRRFNQTRQAASKKVRKNRRWEKSKTNKARTECGVNCSQPHIVSANIQRQSML